MTVTTFDTHALRVVRAVACEGTVSAAARSLGLSSAAVSQMLVRLERRCGTPVVERRGRALLLTDAGRALVRCADLVFEELEDAERELAALAPGRPGCPVGASA